MVSKNDLPQPDQPQNLTEQKTAATEQQDLRQQEMIKRLQEIADLDFSALGYSAQDKEKINNFEAKVLLLVEKCQDDPQQFLQILQENKIAVVKNSKYLQVQKGLPGGGLQQSAGFATQAVIKKQIEKFINQTLAKKELEQVANTLGAVFLSRHPLVKSIWHEGLHALQMLEGFAMLADDPQIQAQRELEVNYLLIRLKQRGWLKDVSLANYHVVGKTAFGEVVQLDPNDIGQEIIYAESNLGKLQAINKEQSESQQQIELEKIRKNIEENKS